MNIFIWNLSWNTEEEDLKDLFNTYSELTKCTIPLERVSGRKRGFGFVEVTIESWEKTLIDMGNSLKQISIKSTHNKVIT